MDYEKKLREYIELIMGNSDYRLNAKDWAFGAIDFASEIGLINSNVREKLKEEYQLLD